MGWEMSMFSVKVPPKIYNKKKLPKIHQKFTLKSWFELNSKLIWSSISSFDYLANVEVPPKKTTKKNTENPPKNHQKSTENWPKIPSKFHPKLAQFQVDLKLKFDF